MTWTKLSLRRSCTLLSVLLVFFSSSPGQWLEGRLKDANNRADYLIITQAQFVPAIQPLATCRASHSSLSVAIVLTDSIYAQFPASVPDSSIRAFLTYAHSFWRKPAPAYVLIAGNTTVVPTHMDTSEFSDRGEDSVAIDQWYVDSLFTYVYGQQVTSPTSAIGRFPAWTVDELSTMVAKTIQYETTSPFPHPDRFIMVADSGDYGVFENQSHELQVLASPLWKDTVTVAVRPTSPQYRSRGEFLKLWNEGMAAVDFLGHVNNVQFSRSKYFSSADIDSLQTGSPLAVCIFTGGQRFQKADTVAMAVDLLRASERGAAAVLAPSGLMYLSEHNELSSAWRHSVVAQPGMSLGMAVKLAKQALPLPDILRRVTLLGDPALVIQHPTIAGITPPSPEPGGFLLSQNYPNPFNPLTVIKYTVGGTPPKADAPPAQRDAGRGTTNIRLVVYDLLGREVAVLVNEPKAAGSYELTFDGSGLSSGTYICRLTAGAFVQSRKMMLVK